MVQTFDFMSKNQTYLYSKSNFFNWKISLDTALHKKTLYQTHKNLSTPIKQCCIYIPISLSTQRSAFLCPRRLCLPFTTIFSWLVKLSCVLMDFSVSTQGFLVSDCVTRGSFGWESYFLDKNMFTSSYRFDSVFGTAFNWLYLQNQSVYVIYNKIATW